MRKKFNLLDYWASVGFIVGEGHIHYSGTLAIRVAQVEKKPLDLLHDLYGGRVYGPYKYNTNQSPYWYWGISGSKAAGVIMTLLYGLKQLSSRKYAQAIKALTSWKKSQLKGIICKRGHHYTIENTYFRPNNGGKDCKICMRQRGKV